MRLISKAGQITVEYFLFVAAVILILLYVIGRPSSPIQQGVKKFVNNTANATLDLIE